jgi:ubiquinone biosynthesis protein COQ4
MSETNYAYSTAPTRNPLRFGLALWRTVRDPTDTHEVSIVEMGFARSRYGRRFARWEEVIAALQSDPRTAPAVRDRRAREAIDLVSLGRLPEKTLGRVFFEHCRARGLNPNLGHIAPDNDVDWLLSELISTHDIWHVTTGWGNDEIGEYGLGGFYVAQLAGASFFGFLLGLAALSTVFRRKSFAEFIAAVTAGYQIGKRTEPLFGVDWSQYWSMPLTEVRSRLGLSGERVLGEGIRAAA